MIQCQTFNYLNDSDQGKRARSIQTSTAETNVISNLHDYDYHNVCVSLVMNNVQIIIIVHSQ